jgi:hypothetical protein
VALVNVAALQLIFESGAEADSTTDSQFFAEENNAPRVFVRERSLAPLTEEDDQQQAAVVQSPTHDSLHFSFEDTQEQLRPTDPVARTPKSANAAQSIAVNTVGTSTSPPEAGSRSSLSASAASHRRNDETPGGATTGGSLHLSATRGRRLPAAPTTEPDTSNPLLQALAEVRRNLRFAVDETQVYSN